MNDQNIIPITINSSNIIKIWNFRPINIFKCTKQSYKPYVNYCTEITRIFSSCMTEVLYPLNSNYFPLPSTLDNIILFYISMSLTTSNTLHKWSCSIFLSVTGLFHLAYSPWVHTSCTIWQDFWSFFKGIR